MNLHNMSTNELIKHTQALGNTTTLTDVLVNKLIKVKSELDKIASLSEDLSNLIDNTTEI